MSNVTQNEPQDYTVADEFAEYRRDLSGAQAQLQRIDTPDAQRLCAEIEEVLPNLSAEVADHIDAYSLITVTDRVHALLTSTVNLAGAQVS